MEAEKATKQFARQTLSIYWRAVSQYKPTLLISALHPIGYIITNVALPFLAGKIIADLITGNEGFRKYLIQFGLFAVIAIFCNRIGFTRLMQVQAKTMSDLNQLVFYRLLHRGVSFHTNRIGGKLVSDALDFIASFSILFGQVLINAIPFVLILVFGLVIIFINSAALGLMVLFIVAVTLAWAAYNSIKRDQLRTNRLIASKNLTSHLSDSIVNAQTVKIFAREQQEIRRNQELNKKLVNLRLHDWQEAGRNGNNRMAMLLVSQFLLLVLVTSLQEHNSTTIATSFFAFTYVFSLTNQLFTITSITRQIEDAFLEAAPMAEILMQPDEIQDKPNATGLEKTQGKLEVENVSFNYREESGNQTVFSKLNLSVKPGEKIGLVGPSGGGKTTLTRLLLRFSDIDQGSIKIDGQNIAEVTQQSLRDAISYVPQEPLLFHRSIGENIGYGKPGASEDEIISAAKKARAHDFIKKLPTKYDTVVGERGVKLSGGQRQRVAIARAILKDAPLLVLDEATSALDSESEVLIQEALWKLMEGRTAIVIAHRLSTIQKMDRIIVLDDGKIVEQGSHKELLEHGGLYATLWQHQSGGFLEDN